MVGQRLHCLTAARIRRWRRTEAGSAILVLPTLTGRVGSLAHAQDTAGRMVTQALLRYHYLTNGLRLCFEYEVHTGHQRADIVRATPQLEYLATGHIDQRSRLAAAL